MRAPRRGDRVVFVVGSSTTVDGVIWKRKTCRSHLPGRPLGIELYMRADVHADGGTSQFFTQQPLSTEGVNWARGWNTKDALAFKAIVMLERSVVVASAS